MGNLELLFGFGVLLFLFSAKRNIFAQKRVAISRV